MIVLVELELDNVILLDRTVTKFYSEDEICSLNKGNKWLKC